MLYCRQGFSRAGWVNRWVIEGCVAERREKGKGGDWGPRPIVPTDWEVPLAGTNRPSSCHAPPLTHRKQHWSTGLSRFQSRLAAFKQVSSETPLSVPQPANVLPYVQSMMKHGAIDSWVSRPSAVGKKWMSSTSVAETSSSTFQFFLKSQKIRNFLSNGMLLNSWHWRRLLNLQNYCCFAVFRGHCAKDIILFAVLLLLYHGTLRVRITLLSFFSSSAPTT